LQVDEVFHDKVVQLDYYIFVGYLLYYNHVVQRKHPNHKIFFYHYKTNKLTALALPPTCIALNNQRKKETKLSKVKILIKSTEVEAIPNLYQDSSNEQMINEHQDLDVLLNNQYIRTHRKLLMTM